MTKSIAVFVALLLFSFSSQDSRSTNISIVPQPAKVVPGNGSFRLGKNVWIGCDAAGMKAAHFLSDELGTKKSLITSLSDKKNQITLSIAQNTTWGDEGYELSVTKKGVAIQANTG